MTRAPSDVTKTELAVLHVLWDLGPSTIRALVDILYPGGEASQYATVQKLLERLQRKGYVTREKGRRANVYSASVVREDLIEHRLLETARDFCNSNVTPLLTQLVKRVKPSPSEITALRDLLDDLEKENG